MFYFDPLTEKQTVIPSTVSVTTSIFDEVACTWDLLVWGLQCSQKLFWCLRRGTAMQASVRFDKPKGLFTHEVSLSMEFS